MISRISAIPTRKLVEHPSKKRTWRWHPTPRVLGMALCHNYGSYIGYMVTSQLMAIITMVIPSLNCTTKYWLPFIMTRGARATPRVFKTNTSLIAHVFSLSHSVIPKGRYLLWFTIEGQAKCSCHRSLKNPPRPFHCQGCILFILNLRYWAMHIPSPSLRISRLLHPMHIDLTVGIPT